MLFKPTKYRDSDPSWESDDDFPPVSKEAIQRGEDGLDRLLGRGKYDKTSRSTNTTLTIPSGGATTAPKPTDG